MRGPDSLFLKADFSIGRGEDRLVRRLVDNRKKSRTLRRGLSTIPPASASDWRRKKDGCRIVASSIARKRAPYEARWRRSPAHGLSPCGPGPEGPSALGTLKVVWRRQVGRRGGGGGLDQYRIGGPVRSRLPTTPPTQTTELKGPAAAAVGVIPPEQNDRIFVLRDGGLGGRAGGFSGRPHAPGKCPGPVVCFLFRDRKIGKHTGEGEKKNASCQSRGPPAPACYHRFTNTKNTQRGRANRSDVRTPLRGHEACDC